MSQLKKAAVQESEPEPVASAPPAASAGFIPEESLPHAFAVVTNRISSTLQRMYSGRFGISVVGWRITAILGSHSPLSAKALAELVALDQVSVTRAVDQLVDRRYVSRRVDTEDRRRVVLRLTRKGEEMYRQVLPLLQAADTAVTSGLSAEDAATLRRLMRQVLAHSGRVLPEDGDWQSVLSTYGPAETATPEE